MYGQAVQTPCDIWRTRRTVLCGLTGEQLPAFHQLVTDPHIRHYLTDGQVLPRAWCEQVLAASDALFSAHNMGLWLVHLEEGGPPVGFCGFHVFADVQPEPQLLYALLPPVTGRGLATELAQALVERAHRQARWPVVYAAVDAPNAASVAVLARAGFVANGRVPGAFGEMLLLEHREHGEADPHRATLALLPPRTLEVASTWDGQAAHLQEVAQVGLAFSAHELTVEVDAPFHGDPAPAYVPGPTPRLWEHEVVELFLLGADQRYLEVELGPHGHHLVLMLEGRRQVKREGMALLYQAQQNTSRWRGVARVPSAWWPAGLFAVNAYAIHGTGECRRYLAWRPTFGTQPDFHQLEAFGTLAP